MSLINFTVKCDLLAARTDSGDTGSDSDVVALVGDVLFTPLFTDEKPILAPSYTPRPAGFKLLPITGYLDSDGQLKSTKAGTVGVRLPANDPVLELEKLTYKVDFDLRTAYGERVRVDGGYFEAPATDGNINLIDVLQSTGAASVSNLNQILVYAHEIVDSTDVGVDLMTADTMLDARSAIGAVGKGDLVVNVKDFGAIGDGQANDTQAVQDAYDFAASLAGTPDQFGSGKYQTLFFPAGKYKIDGGLTANHPLINLHGEGAVIVGEIFVGRNTYESDRWNLYRGTSISGLTFDRNDSYGTTRQLRLANCRGLTIENCYFFRAGKGIAVEYADGNTGTHVMGMLRISNCHFAGLRYGIYTDLINWLVCNDWHIRGCYFNFCSETAVWMWCSNGINIGGVDGLLFSENTVFNNAAYGSSTFNNKQHCLKIGTSNVLIIANNNLFESGLSTIYLADPNTITITGNQIWHTGQLEASDCIEIHGVGGNPVLTGSISNNSFMEWSRAAIGINNMNNVKKLVISNNNYDWKANPSWWHGSGTVDLTTSYRIYQDGTGTDSVGSPKVHEPAPVVGLPKDSIRGADLMASRYQLTDTAGVSGSQSVSKSVTSDTKIFTVADVNGAANPFGGLVSISATKSSGTNAATYLLFVEGSSVSAGSVTVLASSGLLTGNSANWPSFIWSVSTNDLIATPVGSTSGTFDFHAVTLGSLTLT